MPTLVLVMTVFGYLMPAQTLAMTVFRLRHCEYQRGILCGCTKPVRPEVIRAGKLICLTKFHKMRLPRPSLMPTQTLAMTVFGYLMPTLVLPMTVFGYVIASTSGGFYAAARSPSDRKSSGRANSYV